MINNNVNIISLPGELNEDKETLEAVWKELTDHHCNVVSNGTLFNLEQFFSAYSPDPDENLKFAKEDWGDEWEGNGVAYKVLCDLAMSKDKELVDFKSIYILTEW
jgi:hypothetical protein